MAAPAGGELADRAKGAPSPPAGVVVDRRGGVEEEPPRATEGVVGGAPRPLPGEVKVTSPEEVRVKKTSLAALPLPHTNQKHAPGHLLRHAHPRGQPR
jgi:hypothetical protein